MPPKRAGKPLPSTKLAKMSKFTDEQVKINTVDIEKTSMSLVQELEQALNENGSSSRTLHLARTVAKTPDLSPKLTMRLLNFCVKAKSEYVFRQILSNQCVNLKTPEGCELLFAAVNEGQVDIATMLVHSGVDLSNYKTEDKHTILHAVLRSSEIKNNAEKEELVRLLLDYGAEVNARDSKGKSVLHDVIKSNSCSSQLVEILLEQGADVTINPSTNLDDIFWASCYKLDLLPRLIEHQVPDEDTRNKRGFIAINSLIRDKCTGAKQAETTQIIKKILDLGVPANAVDPFPENSCRGKHCPLLCRALYCKQKEVVKLLLEYGADPHQNDDFGKTPLYLATAFAGFTHATRWLIEKGASIHVPGDGSGCYPIHGAVEHKSLKNLHLLMSLGADITVTDNEGYTPFRYGGDIFYINDTHRLVIKYFALIIAKGGAISDDDMARANQYVWGNHHFKKCTEQLEQMKSENICDQISYFSLFSKNIFELLKLMQNPAFARNFKLNEKKRKALFPQYSFMLLHVFEVSEIRYNLFVTKYKQVKPAFDEILPERLIEKITYYSCLEQLKQCQHDYYMSFHANLKNTEKEKIL